MNLKNFRILFPVVSVPLDAAGDSNESLPNVRRSSCDVLKREIDLSKFNLIYHIIHSPKCNPIICPTRRQLSENEKEKDKKQFKAMAATFEIFLQQRAFDSLLMALFVIL